ncbi:MAG: copper amine oxidase N-terminal domain-containing protein, partial [Defluviitaleaceae bacterium]|nr:copper amine oxidase N-terminal domain-containing protein [Defluviitaleaceae bacterium]
RPVRAALATTRREPNPVQIIGIVVDYGTLTTTITHPNRLSVIDFFRYDTHEFVDRFLTERNEFHNTFTALLSRDVYIMRVRTPGRAMYYRVIDTRELLPFQVVEVSLAEDVVVYVGDDNHILTYPEPFIEPNGRLMVGVRSFAVGLGFQVSWSERLRQIILRRDGYSITMHIGRNNFTMRQPNSAPEDQGQIHNFLDAVGPTIIEDRTFLPIRSLAETMGYLGLAKKSFYLFLLNQI